MLKIRTTCPLCGKINYVEVSAIGFMRWQEEGVCIHKALPELSDNDRELLETGICPKCWDGMFEKKNDDPYCDCEWVEEGLPKEDLDEISNMMAFQKACAQNPAGIEGLAMLLPR